MLSQPDRVRYEHDYWNLINPAHEQYKKEMWEEGLASIFLSPAHFIEYRRIYPKIRFRNVYFQPSPVSGFYPDKKKPICISVGVIGIHKGTLDALEWARAKNIRLTVYGASAPGDEYVYRVKTHPNVDFRGPVAYSVIQKAMAEADMFIHLPVWVEPYGRVAVEARLAGCRIISNHKLGVASYPWWWEDDFETLRDMLQDIGKEFWKFIDSL
jgi:glycosyltransferase involved in cell wall biosynthesis